MDEKIIKAVKEARREIVKNSTLTKIADDKGKFYLMAIYETPNYFKEAVANLCLYKNVRIKLFVSKTQNTYEFIPEKQYPFVKVINNGRSEIVNAYYGRQLSK